VTNTQTDTQASVYSNIFFGEGNFPENLQSPSKKTAAKLCALNLFSAGTNELQIYHGNFLLMDNKHRKLFVGKQSIGCKFMPKMHQNTIGGRTPAGLTGGDRSRNGVPASKGREGMGRGAISNGGRRKGRREGTEREGKEISPKSR